MPFYRFANQHPDVDGNVTVTPQDTNAAPAVHPHTPSDIPGSKNLFDGKAEKNHSHPFVTSIGTPEAESVSGDIQLSGSRLTQDGTEITLNGLTSSVQKPASEWTQTGLATEDMDNPNHLQNLIATPEFFGVQSETLSDTVKAVELSNGQKASKVMVYAGGGETQIYPPPAKGQIHLETSTDALATTAACPEHVYGLPICGDDEITLNVHVEPEGSEWYVTAEGWEIPNIGAATVHRGKKEITLTLSGETPTAPVRVDVQIRAVTGEVMNAFSFFRFKSSGAAGHFARWAFDGNANCSDSRFNLTTSEENPQYSPGVRGQAYGPTRVEKTAFKTAIPAFNAVNGATLSGFVRKAAGNNSGFGFGFWDTLNHNYEGNNFSISVDSGFPGASTTAKRPSLTMNRNGAPRPMTDTTKFYHMALVLKLETTGKYTFIFYFDGREVDRQSDCIISAELLRTIGGASGAFEVQNNNPESAGFYVDDVKLFTRALTASEIALEATAAGLGGEPEVKPPKVEEVFKRFKPPASELAFTCVPHVIKLTDKVFCIAGDYEAWYTAQLTAEYGDFLTAAHTNALNGYRNAWSTEFHNKFRLAELQIDYEPLIRQKWESLANFNFNGRGVRHLGSWVTSSRMFRFPDFATGKPVSPGIANNIQYAYFELESPLTEGETLAVSAVDGSFELSVENAKMVSRAIKINQCGYHPSAAEKYAYVGAWLGTGGKLELSALAGTPFYIRNTARETVFTGTIQRRVYADTHKSADNPAILQPVTGEDLLELSFSAFEAEGTYHLFVPGIGKSFDFEVSPNAAAVPFYIHTRGLFHQRSGTSKTKPYTNWPLPEGHQVTFKGNHPPNPGQWKYCRNANGKDMPQSGFSLVTAGKTNQRLHNVKGGWWDAGDWDRRHSHIESAGLLTDAYLIKPQKFYAGQLHIPRPEGDTSTPDILLEAQWGVEVWRKLQTPEGGVGMWVEAEAHPTLNDISKDAARYYAAAQTRESTLSYCYFAAKLAYAFKVAGNRKKYRLFRTSALKAWDWAVQDSNRCQRVYRINGEQIFFTEPDIPEVDFVRPAAALYLLTRQERFAQHLTAENLSELCKGYLDPNNYTGNYCLELYFLRFHFPALFEQWKNRVTEAAQFWRNLQKTEPYRNIFWNANHPYYFHRSWSGGLPASRGRILVYAHFLTGNADFLSGIRLASDYVNGCNVFGNPMTTGLGYTYPCSYLSCHQFDLYDKTGLYDPIPGITPYGISGNISGSSVQLTFGLFYDARTDHQFGGISLNLLPAGIKSGTGNTRGDIAVRLLEKQPVLRRYSLLEGQDVPQNEFTVWETVAPNAFLSAYLLPDGWLPSDELKAAAPKPNTELFNAIPLP